LAYLPPAKDVCKVVFFPFFTVYLPKAIFDVPLCHENLGVVIGFGKGMNDSTQGLTQLIQGSSWCHFYGGVVYRLKYPTVLEAKAEG